MPRQMLIQAVAKGYADSPRRSFKLSSGRRFKRWDLWPLGVISGIVRNADTEEPIANALVGGWTEKVRSDAAGRYELEGVSLQQSHRIRVQADGFAAQERYVKISDSGRTSANFALDPMTELSVLLIDVETGAAVGPGRFFTPSASATQLAQANAGGQAALPIARNVFTWFRVEADGYADLVWGWRPEAGPLPVVRLPMHRAAELRVEASYKGKPFEGLSVRVLESQGYGQQSARWNLDRARVRSWGLPGHFYYQTGKRVRETDAEGCVSLPVLPRLEEMHVQWSGFGMVSSKRSFLAPDSKARPVLRVELERGARILGVAERNSQPWQGWILWRHPASGQSGRVLTSRQQRGAFLIQALPPGEIDFEPELVARPRPAGLPVRVSVRAGEKLVRDLRWTEKEAWIHGVVLDADGRPAPRIRVSAELPGAGGSSGLQRSRTDESGRFGFLVSITQPYRLRAFHNGLSSEPKLVMAGPDEVELRLRSAADLRVELLDKSTGRRLTRDDFRGKDPGSAIAWRVSGAERFERMSLRFEEDGFFTLHLPVGRVDLRFELPSAGFAPRLLRRLELPQGGLAAPLRVELERERGLELRMQLSSRKGLWLDKLAGHWFFLLRDRELSSIRVASGPGAPAAKPGRRPRLEVDDPGLWRRQLHFESNGMARLPALAPGRYHLVSFPKGLRIEPSVLELRQARGQAPVRFRVWPPLDEPRSR
jgi:hypothetical protein